MKNRSPKWYGWLPDLPDQRDLYLMAEPVAAATSSDLTTVFGPACEDQGSLGCCTGFGNEFVDRFVRFKGGHPAFVGSRLFVYYGERVIEGTVNEDSGASIRDGIKAMARWGVCPEKDCPYVISKFARKPTKKAFTNAERAQILQYRRVAPSQIRSVLTSGWPVVFGFTVYESFESKEVSRTGIVPLPGPAEQVLGGHCTVIVGHNDAQKRFKVRNSWGTDWGDDGYFYLPYEFINNPNLADDFWVVTMTE